MEALSAIGEFIQNQIFGMKWLNALIGNLLSAAGLDTEDRLGGSVQFFLYDVIKITLLLCFLIFLIFTVSERMDFEDGAIYVIKAVMALVIYFYSVNILKNATILSPHNRFVNVLYMLMTIDFIEKFFQNFQTGFRQKCQKLITHDTRSTRKKEH